MAKMRSDALMALEKKYKKIRESQSTKAKEPKNAGRSLSDFVELGTKVAEDYKPSSYISRSRRKS